MPKTDVRTLIVQSATDFFSKFGFSKTTMDEIAKHIHKAKGLIYYYFRSKEELFNEVLRQELNRVKEELSKIALSDGDSLVLIKNYFLIRIKLLHKATNYHETLKADFFEKYHFVKDVRDDFVQFERTQLTLILNKANKEGYLTLKNINSTVNIILMVANGIEIPLYLQNKYEEYEKTIQELSEMILNSLRYGKK